MKNPIVQLFFSALLLLAALGVQAQTVYGTYDRNSGAVQFTGNEAQVKANFLQALNDPGLSITEVFIYKFPDAEKFVLTGRVTGANKTGQVGIELVPDGKGGLGVLDKTVFLCQNSQSCRTCAWVKLSNNQVSCDCLPRCSNCCNVMVIDNPPNHW